MFPLQGLGGLWHPSQKPVVRIMGAQKLQRIIAKDHCMILGYKMNPAQPISLVQNSTREVLLDGFVNLRELIQHGSGNTTIAFVDTDHLNITQAHGRTVLAGVANKLRASISGDASLRAQHLRVNDAWLLGRQKAQGYINPQKHLFIKAKDHAQISYTQKTKNHQLLSQEHANITHEPLQKNVISQELDETHH